MRKGDSAGDHLDAVRFILWVCDSDADVEFDRPICRRAQRRLEFGIDAAAPSGITDSGTDAANQGLCDGDALGAEAIRDHQGGAGFGADAVRIVDRGGFDDSMRNAEDDAVDLRFGFAKFDAAQAANELLLERLEAAAAPEH